MVSQREQLEVVATGIENAQHNNKLVNRGDSSPQLNVTESLGNGIFPMSTSSQIVDVEDNDAADSPSDYDGDESGGSAKEEHMESSDDDSDSDVKREI